MTTEIEKEKDWELMMLGQEMSEGPHPYPSEFKGVRVSVALPFFRHRTSFALANTPNRYFSVEKAIEWINGDRAQEVVLLKDEIPVIINHRLTLPFTTQAEWPVVVSDVLMGLGPATRDPDQLKWFEPSIHYQRMRIERVLDDPKSIVGFTSGRF